VSIARRAAPFLATLSFLLISLPWASAGAPLPAALERPPFIANEGQTAAEVAYYASTVSGTVFVTRRGELVYRLRGTSAGRDRSAEVPGWSLTETLVRGRARPVARDRHDARVSYFVGNSRQWRSDIATWDGVDLGDVWPGVAVSVRASAGSVEKIFTVRPGASVDRIRVRVSGARALAVDAQGALVARTGLGPVTFTAPIAYQEHDGVRREVSVAYRQRGREYGFAVGAYDSTRPLVIDPLLQATYLGGSGSDQAAAIAIAPATGDVYVTGQTTSTNFPGTAGGAQNSKGGYVDVFVARLSGSLTTLLHTTYLGGSAFDHPEAIAVSPRTGDVYVAGYTYSTDFPGTMGAAQPTSAAGGAFVARLSGDLTILRRATYLAGSGGDYATALAIHPATGDVYVAGSTSSTDFPVTAGAAQSTSGGRSDAFVARLTESLASLTGATYLGGDDYDYVNALAIAPGTGDIYVAGSTQSGNLPGTIGGAQRWSGGTEDAFVARFSGTLTTLIQATYLGGQGSDLASALAIHPTTGDIYVAGHTGSTNFPGTSGGAQPSNGGGSTDTDAFVARLTSSLTALVGATYLGGDSSDEATALAISPRTGEVYVAGNTISTNFPGTNGGVQPTNAGGYEVFVARLGSGLATLIQATYLGGRFFDQAQALAIGANGDVYLAGQTYASPDFPGTAGGAQPSSGGDQDAFVARLSASLAAADAALDARANVNQAMFSVGQTVTTSFLLTNPGMPAEADLYVGALLPDGVTIVCWTTNGGLAVGSLADLRSLRPYATRIALPAPFSMDRPNFFSYQWMGTEPRGRYVFFVFASRAGALADGVVTADEILVLSTAPFTFP
jgi:uncharacterized repeat protein (TIGR01451 family)